MSGLCLLKNKVLSIKVLLTLVVLTSAFTSSAQVFYSTQPDYLKSKTEQNNLLLPFKSAYPDTSLNELSNYAPRNYLGNIGLSSPDYLFRYDTKHLGFQLYDPNLSNQRIAENEVLYFKSRGPYVDLQGFRGSKAFQGFKLLYTQSFKNNFNVTLKFNRNSSTGYYLHQESSTQNIMASSNYTTKKNRFGYYFYYLNNEHKLAENGGIIAVSLNDSTLFLNKDFLAVNLSAANRLNREQKVMVNPWWRLNKIKDSVSGLNHFLQFKLAYVNNLYLYTDEGMANDNFYERIYLDTVRTSDSTRIKQFVNEINYSVQSANKRLAFSGGYKNEINLLWQKSDSTFMNHIAQGDFAYANFNRNDTAIQSGFETKANVQYVVGGTNVGNYKLESNSVWWLNRLKKQTIFLDAFTENRSADFIFNNWTGNNFRWRNNGFKNQQQSQVRAGVNLNRYFKASVFYQNVFNYLYFNNEALPAQFGKNIHNTGLSVAFNKVFFKHLGLSVAHTFQNTSHTAYFRMPQHISEAKLFYETASLKNILITQFGAQVQVYDSFKAYNFMPATQVFYLQPNFKTAACPFLDVFLHVRIRPVTLFFKVENVLQGFVGTNYAFVPGYQQPGRAFRFGINWVFFD